MTMEPGSGRWQYRCEGNSNIVVADVQKSVVLRILKEPLVLPENLGQALVKGKVERIKAFYEAMVNQRLRYALCPKIVDLEPEVLQEIKSQIEAWRPEHRKNEGKDIFTKVATCALELPDLCAPLRLQSDATAARLPVYTVELKPKMGYFVQPMSAASASAGAAHMAAPAEGAVPRHNGVQRFGCFLCLTERYPKYSSSKVDSNSSHRHPITQFCPVDLFSGNRNRMRFALRALFDSYKTLPNRFRIFRDGIQIRPSNCPNLSNELHVHLTAGSLSPFFRNEFGQTSIDELLSLVAEALLRPAATVASSCPAPNCNCNGCPKCPAASSHTAATATATPAAADSAHVSSKTEPAVSSAGCQYLQQHRGHVARPCEFSPLPGTAAGWHPQLLPPGCVLDELLRALHECPDTAESIYEQHYVPLVRGAAACTAAQLVPTSEYVAASPLPAGGQQNGSLVNGSADSDGSHACLARLHVAALKDPDFDPSVDFSDWWTTVAGDLGSSNYCKGPSGPACHDCDVRSLAANGKAGHSQVTRDSLRKVSDFLFAKTVKDCSIMITLQPLNGVSDELLPATTEASATETFFLQDSSGVHYAARVAVIDLDPKPFSKIPMFAKSHRHFIKSLLSGPYG